MASPRRWSARSSASTACSGIPSAWPLPSAVPTPWTAAASSGFSGASSCNFSGRGKIYLDICNAGCYNIQRWLCASAGTGRQARLRCVCLRRTGSSPVSRTSGKLPLPSRESHFVGFAIFIARVSDWHQFRHPNPGKTPHSCLVFFVAQCAISSFSLIANSMFNGGAIFVTRTS